MQNSRFTVYGIVQTPGKAEKVYKAIKKNGYADTDISIVTKPMEEDDGEIQVRHNVAQGVGEGVAAGLTIGGIAGLIAGLTAITVPGIGAVFFAGPIVALLGMGGAAAAAISGTVSGLLAGGLLGALAGLGIPEETAKIYADEVRAGSILIGVDVDNEKQATQLNSLMEKNGASLLHVHERGN